MAFLNKVDQAKKRLKNLENERLENDKRIEAKLNASRNPVEIERLQTEREKNWQRYESFIESAKNEVDSAQQLLDKQEESKRETENLKMKLAKDRARTSLLIQGVSEKDFEEIWWPKILEKTIVDQIKIDYNLNRETTAQL